MLFDKELVIVTEKLVLNGSVSYLNAYKQTEMSETDTLTESMTESSNDSLIEKTTETQNITKTDTELMAKTDTELMAKTDTELMAKTDIEAMAKKDFESMTESKVVTIDETITKNVSEMPIIFKTSNELVMILKKRFKEYKNIIKEKTDSRHRLPFVKLSQSSKLDKCSLYVKSRGFSKTTDDKLNRLCKRLDNNYNESNDEHKERKDIKQSNDFQINKKRKYELIDIFKGDDDIDNELDRKDRKKYLKTNNQTNGESDKSTSNDKNGSKFTKLKEFESKCEPQRKPQTYQYISSKQIGLKSQDNGLSIYNSNLNELNFKIPKKDSQDTKSMLDRAQSLRTSKRYDESFNHLVRNLTENQWKEPIVLELLILLAKGMASSKDFYGPHTNTFADIIDKIKSLQYIEDDFWDFIIYCTFKKNTNNKSHQINLFLSGLYEYLLERKISARVVCNEAVIIAYRTLNNQLSTKELLDMQSID
ncbi:anaphase-promoting complex subunit 6-like [Oppia nitens]|uniref:anaphase-promoting complex subunit 6-like n=1 Tax=Oppia nitens TaxID=1686743 RepID=UPI0023DB271E|nr:anaphase-promoting complex subunit 6-like [Oppia nitens]